jgi:hypothetical protein
MVWAQPHIPHIKYRGRKDTGNLQNKSKTKATRRPSDPFLQKPREKQAETPSRSPGPNPLLYGPKTSHQTSLKASHTFQHLPSKRRSLEATARSSPYPPRGSGTAYPRYVRARGKQGRIDPWLYVVAGIERSKAAGAHSGVLSGSRGCCTGAGG